MSKKVWTLIGLAIFIGTLLLSPAFHWLYFELIYLHPTGLVGLALLLSFTLGASMLEVSLRKEIGFLTWSTLLGGLVLWLVYVIFSGSIFNSYLAQATNYNRLSAPYETMAPRYLPFEIAQKFAANRTQNPLLQVRDIDPVLEPDGQFNWIGPRTPNGIVNYFARQANGVIKVRPDGSTVIKEGPFRYGEGMGIGDAIKWQLYLTRYWAYYPEIFYAQSGEELLAVTPYVTYKYRFPVMLPQWGGVIVVHQNGLIEDLTPEQAIKDVRFIGQRIYPEYLARVTAQAWAYRNGIWNAWFVHSDQTEMPTIPSGGNQQPYLLSTKAGPMWFVGLEPYGPSYSIYKMLFFNAHDGTLGIYETNQETGLIGPAKAVEYTHSAWPQYNWYTTQGEGSSGSILAIEPLPIFRGENLYWQVSVTTRDYAGVSTTALVDAATTEVVAVSSLEEMQGFLAGTFAGRLPTGQVVQNALPQPVVPAPTDTDYDVTGLSNEDLLHLIETATQELLRRGGSK